MKNKLLLIDNIWQFVLFILVVLTECDKNYTKVRIYKKNTVTHDEWFFCHECIYIFIDNHWLQ